MYDAKLKGKNALVTSSTSGIGLTIAKELMAGGCNVMLNGYGEQSAIEVQRQQLAQSYEVKVGYIAANLSNPSELEALLKGAKSELGSLDILVNNSSAPESALIDELSDEQWQHILAENLSSAFYAIRQVLPIMKKQAWGRIINVATAQGLVATSKKAGYIAAKYGLVGLTKGVGEDIKSGPDESLNVTCNALCPGLSRADEFAIKPQEELIISHQGIETRTENQLGQLILFLCSDAAQDINGEVLPVSG